MEGFIWLMLGFGLGYVIATKPAWLMELPTTIRSWLKKTGGEK